jgi:hypothetical protein
MTNVSFVDQQIANRPRACRCGCARPRSLPAGARSKFHPAATEDEDRYQVHRGLFLE